MKVSNSTYITMGYIIKLHSTNFDIQVIDYTKSDPKSIIPPESVDFIVDTVGLAMEYLSLLRPRTGCVISIATAPSGSQLQAYSRRVLHTKGIPFYARLALNIQDSICSIRAWRYSVSYSFMFLELNGRDLDTFREFVEDGKLKPVVGTVVDFHDIEAVRNACTAIHSGKGEIGKAVITFKGNEPRD
jgi:NADPH:quinone reductase-like Zn-dependent oxidoreductase